MIEVVSASIEMAASRLNWQAEHCLVDPGSKPQLGQELCANTVAFSVVIICEVSLDGI